MATGGYVNDTVIQIGDRVKDKLTGLQGIATAITSHITGCKTVAVSAEKLDKSGGIPDAIWLDENRLAIVKKRANVLQAESAKTLGGPQDKPLRSAK